MHMILNFLKCNRASRQRLQRKTDHTQTRIQAKVQAERDGEI